MIQETVRAPARCEGCGKSYRVPDADRTYSCKACGGRVRAIVVNSEPGQGSTFTLHFPRRARRA